MERYKRAWPTCRGAPLCMRMYVCPFIHVCTGVFTYILTQAEAKTPATSEESDKHWHHRELYRVRARNKKLSDLLEVYLDPPHNTHLNNHESARINQQAKPLEAVHIHPNQALGTLVFLSAILYDLVCLHRLSVSAHLAHYVLRACISCLSCLLEPRFSAQ
jgi:hypothetical protein